MPMTRYFARRSRRRSTGPSLRSRRDAARMPCSSSVAAASASTCAPPSGSATMPSITPSSRQCTASGLKAAAALRASLASRQRIAAHPSGRDDRVDRVLLHQHAIGDRDRDRAPGAPFADDARDGRDVQAHHRRLRARDRAPLAVLLGRDARIRAGRVDQRDERKAVPLRESHGPHCLPVPLRVRHPEVPVRAFLEIASLLVPDEDDRAPAELPEARDERMVVRAAPVAVQLEEVLEDPLDVVERVRPVRVPSELDRLPDLLGARVRPDVVELILEARELTAELRAAQELHAAELTEPLAQPQFVLVRHYESANSLSSRPSVGRSSARGTIASRWPKR